MIRFANTGPTPGSSSRSVEVAEFRFIKFEAEVGVGAAAARDELGIEGRPEFGGCAGLGAADVSDFGGALRLGPK